MDILFENKVDFFENNRLYLMLITVNRNTLIKSGGGIGPAMPSNLQRNYSEKVLIPTDCMV